MRRTTHLTAPASRSSVRRPFRATARGSTGGNALIAALFAVTIAMGLAYSTAMISVSELARGRLGSLKLRAEYTANAGMELAVNELKKLTQRATITSPFDAIDRLLHDENGERTITQLYVDHDLVQGGKKHGTVCVQLHLVGSSTESRYVSITVDAYVPNRYRWVNGKQLECSEACARQQRTVRVAFERPEVFDYGLFINSSATLTPDLTCEGNVRLNGRLEVRGGIPTISPCIQFQRFELAKDPDTGTITASLREISDAAEGGVFASLGAVDAEGGALVASLLGEDQAYLDPVAMPNLNDLSIYEELARNRTVNGETVPSSIRIGSTVVSGPVYGAEPGENGPLYLRGTKADPIVVDGPVVVHCDLVISGYITGQGCFFVAGDIHVPDDVIYRDPPSSWTPDSNTAADTVDWIAANLDHDLIGFFARDDIVIGDSTDAWWQADVEQRLLEPANTGDEDAGADQILGTLYGLDGMEATRDDDALEGDGQFTIETYSEEDALLSTIPEGRSVGDPIPGTGEDTDGDGEYDGEVALDDLIFAPQLSPSQWGGNPPTEAGWTYSKVARLNVSRLDGVYYTNHAIALSSEKRVTFNGAVICRSEALVTTREITVRYDRRLIRGVSIPNIVWPRAFTRITSITSVRPGLGGRESLSLIPVIAPLQVRADEDPPMIEVGKLMRKTALLASDSDAGEYDDSDESYDADAVYSYDADAGHGDEAIDGEVVVEPEDKKKSKESDLVLVSADGRNQTWQYQHTERKGKKKK